MFFNSLYIEQMYGIFFFFWFQFIEISTNMFCFSISIRSQSFILIESRKFFPHVYWFNWHSFAFQSIFLRNTFVWRRSIVKGLFIVRSIWNNDAGMLFFHFIVYAQYFAEERKKHSITHFTQRERKHIGKNNKQIWWAQLVHYIWLNNNFFSNSIDSIV